MKKLLFYKCKNISRLLGSWDQSSALLTAFKSAHLSPSRTNHDVKMVLTLLVIRLQENVGRWKTPRGKVFG